LKSFFSPRAISLRFCTHQFATLFRERKAPKLKLFSDESRIVFIAQCVCGKEQNVALFVKKSRVATVLAVKRFRV
jgi:hypothetical protein